jgi:hypothetical protein
MKKTLVIGIYLHGEYHLEQNGNIKTDIIPNGMCVNIIHAASPGVPDVSTLEVKENIAQKISEKIQTNRNYDGLTNAEIESLTFELRDLLVRENKQQAKNIIKLHQYQYKHNKITPMLQHFSHYYDNAFKIESYDKLRTIPNKIFSKFSKGELINPYNIKPNYVNKIIIYNLEEEPDLFDIFKLINRNIETISLVQLLTFFRSLGVENLIIIDSTCSVFKGDKNHLTDRNIRQLRRQMLSSFI